MAVLNTACWFVLHAFKKESFLLLGEIRVAITTFTCRFTFPSRFYLLCGSLGVVNVSWGVSIAYPSQLSCFETTMNRSKRLRYSIPQLRSFGLISSRISRNISALRSQSSSCEFLQFGSRAATALPSCIYRWLAYRDSFWASVRMIWMVLRVSCWNDSRRLLMTHLASHRSSLEWKL